LLGIAPTLDSVAVQEITWETIRITKGPPGIGVDICVVDADFPLVQLRNFFSIETTEESVTYLKKFK
jgi:hypothetical protein